MISWHEHELKATHALWMHSCMHSFRRSQSAIPMILITCIAADILWQPSILPCLWMHVDAWEVKFRTLTYLVAVQCKSSHNTSSSQD